MKLVLKNNNDSILDAKIRLDGLGERHFRKSLTTYLRRQLNQNDKKVFKNLRFRDSNKDVLIQLADMVAGAIKRSYDLTKKDSQLYRAAIDEKLEDVWEFGENQ